MSSYQWLLLAAALVLCVGTGSNQPVVAMELLQHPDLPPGLLYPSGASDPDPASIHSVTHNLQNPPYEGAYPLVVHTGTEQNGGQNYGGVYFAMPDSFLNLLVPSFYRLSFAMKGDPFVDVHISNQDGGGQANTLSHIVTLDAGWLLYEHETVLTGEPLPNGHLNLPRTTLFFWTDATSGGPNQTFNIDSVRLEGFLAADFNESGSVDGSDIQIWQQGFGQGVVHAAGDANGDGDVDGYDFLVTQRQYQIAPNGRAIAAVPEQATVRDQGGSEGVVFRKFVAARVP